MPRSPWDMIDDVKYQDEAKAIAGLLARQPLSLVDRRSVVKEAAALVVSARGAAGRQGVVEDFLKQFSLGTREGLALMCLAEALLRTPDPETRDRLIAEKIGSADWAAHIGRSDSLFVNASTWGLLLTGKLIDADEAAKKDLGGYIKRIATRIGEPVIRQAVGAAVKMMGEQFVLGRTIEAALARAAREDTLCSFDMLGEGARTEADAERYERIYADAIEAVGKAAGGAGPERGHGVSVKLSALCPRYEAVQPDRIWDELYPRMKRLALIAARHDLNFAIDAEEADRLIPSLELIDRLVREPELGEWTGLGVVVQAYQKRAPQVIAALARLARESGRRIMVRLVKGAYWDSEIKRAQVAGLPDYPVYTTKAATDLSYIVCAKALIDAAPALYPQFASHNAHTVAAVRRMAGEAGVQIEHQRLHGMGEALYAGVTEHYGPVTLRAYAPVGGHEELLPYLVRRLLENGANTGFVHALLDETIPAVDVVRDPIAIVEAHPRAHARIPLPRALYGPARLNSVGRDYAMESARAVSAKALEAVRGETLRAGPIIGGKLIARAAVAVTNPADRAVVVGQVGSATVADVASAAKLARKAQPRWNALTGTGRAPVLRAMADAFRASLAAAIKRGEEKDPSAPSTPT